MWTYALLLKNVLHLDFLLLILVLVEYTVGSCMDFLMSSIQTSWMGLYVIRSIWGRLMVHGLASMVSSPFRTVEAGFSAATALVENTWM